MAVPVARTATALRQAVAGWRDAGEHIALVPTMGALHEGHLALVRQGRRRAGRVVVSIFVNPTQFGPGEDLSKYPRTFADDRRRLDGLADLIFAPAVEEMYPEGAATTVSVAGPAAVGLEDRFRPTHFPGVATVVAKLLIQATPDVALFGEKDYQQLKVVTRMAADLLLPVRIVPGATVREPDGLALSSRNRYLSPADRAKAPLLHRSLQACAAAVRAGAPLADALAQARQSVTSAGFDLDYLEARDAETLAPVASPGEAPLRLLVAARIGTTRLIDNIAV
ncbi:MAG TPA: pantoate--beta-alanine ligase [Beijerinckiaceae bacterium]|nr:pantoate--beta-alanine ligase [Beijerinckiaceae bacterium]